MEPLARLTSVSVWEIDNVSMEEASEYFQEDNPHLLEQYLLNGDVHGKRLAISRSQA